MKSAARFAALSLLLLVSSGPARAETTACAAITSVPYTISAPGIYCLTESLSMSSAAGNAITIAADDVVVDLNGHTLDGSGAGTATTASGIATSGDLKNVTVRNGTVRGFFVGVGLSGTVPFTTSQGYVVERMRADRNTLIGIGVQGRGGIVRDNLIVKTGGSTAPAAGGAYTVKAVWGSGPGVYIVNNRIIETIEPAIGSASGVLLTFAPGAAVERNFISDAAAGTKSVGISVYFCEKVTVVGNRIVNVTDGISYGGSTGLYMGNTVSGSGWPYTGGTAAGATNFSF